MGWMLRGVGHQMDPTLTRAGGCVGQVQVEWLRGLD